MSSTTPPPIVPLTVVSAQNSNQWPAIAIGSNTLQPSGPTTGSYWYVVIDRTSLAVLANVFSSDSQNVPPGIAAFAGNSQVILIVATSAVTINNVPQGGLYQFLVTAGANNDLSRVEQINLQLSCGVFGQMSYIFVGILGTGLQGLEASSLSQTDPLGAVLTAQLLPTVINGVVFYSPVEIAV